MGYSATTRAFASLDAIQAALQCVESDNQKPDALLSNLIEYRGRRFFWEIGRENEDGAITGTMYRLLADGRYVRHSSFRIEPSGVIARPLWARRAAYRTGFALLKEDRAKYYDAMELAGAFTANGVEEGDIYTIG